MTYKWTIIWSIIMLILMLRPSSELNVPPLFEGFDKLAHCGTFFVFTTLLYWEIGRKKQAIANKWVTICNVALTGLLFGGATEMAQLFLSSTRSADWWDFFADSVGVGMSSFAYLLFYKK